MKKLNTRITDQERQFIRDKASFLLTKRRGLVHKPWDTSPYKFYFQLFPTDLRAAVTLVAEKMDGNFKKMLYLNTQASVKLKGASDISNKRNTLTFIWKGEKPCFDSGWSSDNSLKISERHPAWNVLYQFCTAAAKVDDENDAVRDLVKHVVMYCNTYGQIHRVWPDLLPTIGGEKVAAAEGQQRKSQLPQDLDTDKVFRERELATMKLAQASLMPELPNHFTWI